MENINKWWNLQLFGEGGEGAAAPGGEAAGEAAEPQEQAEPTFDEILEKNPAYKAAYEHKLRGHLSNRMKTVNAEREAVMPLLMAVGEQYGIDVSDPKNLDVGAIVKAYTEDESRLEQEAMEHGYSVENWKELKKARQITAERKREEAEARNRQEFDRIWEESEQLKQIYPGFDLGVELQNPQFGDLLSSLQKSGFSNAVRTAYESVHRDEIMGGAMQYAVQRTKQQVSNSIQAGARRPAENGSAAPAETRIDITKLSREERADIRRRVQNGEHITFR